MERRAGEGRPVGRTCPGCSDRPELPELLGAARDRARVTHCRSGWDQELLELWPPGGLRRCRRGGADTGGREAFPPAADPSSDSPASADLPPPGQRRERHLVTGGAGGEAPREGLPSFLSPPFLSSSSSPPPLAVLRLPDRRHGSGCSETRGRAVPGDVVGPSPAAGSGTGRIGDPLGPR
ncbi:hypothetical protein NDU88_001183 [Pleurodeles waltl]|uniref:Uncharacterized protein n=1 Tax=Pleurodeles waltl TaxID=8319 RepID=A0AAV7NEF2_PLEWA|nr:hypothetical protein NDU88_001183 [Pleurodeles waltl]